MVKILIKSKYFKIALLILLSAMMILAGTSRIFAGKMILSDDSLDKLESQGIDVVISFGEYRELKVIDGERNLAAGKNNDGEWELIDLKTHKTAVLDDIESVDEGGGNLVTLKAGDGYIVADTDRLLQKGKMTDKAIVERCESAYSVRYDRDGNYVLIEDEGSYRIIDSDGGTLYENNDCDRAFPSMKSGYVVEENNEVQRIRNIYTGEIACELEPHEAIERYCAGRWIVSVPEDPNATFLKLRYYILDDDFTKNEEVGEFFYYEGYEKYIYAQKARPVDMIVDEQGEVVYNCENDKDWGTFIGAAGDVAFFRGNSYGYVKYADFKNGGPENAKEYKELCFMDFEDGTALTAKHKDGGYGNIEEASVESIKSDYKYGFKDSSFNDLTGFVFDKAYKSENGYAVVVKGMKYALIDLKGAALR